ncbi:hypothetical protein GVX81_03430 [[Haemophilus] felis]|uniref:DUF8095 domain-containing protein n=1 Tax=[Haemophilus] felis TaxID=123822 RepID=A0A1T0B2L2_9PAST|nr:hypothetical protein [[Haemophilus] felis]OOS04312.1 hypothetical protein B0188_05130 [[Haemophilus] felis]
MNFKILLFITYSFFCSLSFAESWSIHISEEGIDTSYIPSFGKKSDIFYVDRNSGKELNPSNSLNDASILGDSIEFEVYEINESRTSHTIFESGAGICNGYNSKSGVYVTDSTTYYIIPENKKEYYKNIAIGKISSKEKIQNVQYVPVFYVQDPNLAEKIQKEDAQKGKILAKGNIKNRSNMISHIVCKPE